MKYDIKDKSLRKSGKDRILWALERMPVLELVRKDFSEKKPLKGITIGACLHVTTETAALAITLKSAGANVAVCASNPLSTQDDTAASLVFDYGIPVFAVKGENNKKYYQHIYSVLGFNPQITLDDGADLISTIHKQFYSGKFPKSRLPWASTEETTTGVIRLKALEKSGKLLYPIIAVNDAYTKHLFDNRYGTGQSTLDGILRATNKLIAGTVFLTCGYGWCSRGIAQKARGLGANVIVAEVDPLKALEAVMDGFLVMPIKDAVKRADIIVTATGDINVIRREHFPLMKDKVVIANSGHFNVEIETEALQEISRSVKEVKPLVKQFVLKNNKRVYLLAEGRLVNLSCAEGHPAEVMDMSFANQALSCRFIAEKAAKLSRKVYKVPDFIDQRVAKLKLASLGVRIDNLTRRQKEYLHSWQAGT